MDRVRRLEILLALTWALIFAFGALSLWTQGSPVHAEPTPGLSQGKVIVDQLILVDPKGRTRAKLSCEDSVSGLSLFDEQGKKKASFSIADSQHGSGLSILDSRGQEVLLGTDGNDVCHLVIRNEVSQVTLGVYQAVEDKSSLASIGLKTGSYEADSMIGKDGKVEFTAKAVNGTNWKYVIGK